MLRLTFNPGLARVKPPAFLKVILLDLFKICFRDTLVFFPSYFRPWDMSWSNLNMWKVCKKNTKLQFRKSIEFANLEYLITFDIVYVYM